MQCNGLAGGIVAQRYGDDRALHDARIRVLVNAIHQRHGPAVRAILLYGSYLRGKRDTLLDFYVLLDSYKASLPRPWHGWANRLLPPNVYYLHQRTETEDARAKYATMRLDRFERAMSRPLDVSFWARFAQPGVLLYSRDPGTRDRILDALLNASRTFIRQTLPMLPNRFDVQELWVRGLGLTYGCELRTEKADQGLQLYRCNQDYFTRLTEALGGEGELPEMTPEQPGRYLNTSTPGERRRARLHWHGLRWRNKTVSVLRLTKATATFEDPLDYILWKIARHSGVRVEASERQRRYPLVFAWGLLWRIYRRGGFR